MELLIEKKRDFNCPQGNFRALMTNIRPQHNFDHGKMVSCVRLTLDVEAPGNEENTITVARNFTPSLEPGSPLRQILESWLGKEFFNQNTGNKFELDDLLGRKADITVEHIQNKGRPNPYCHLAAMYPPGTLPLGEFDDE